MCSDFPYRAGLSLHAYVGPVRGSIVSLTLLTLSLLTLPTYSASAALSFSFLTTITVRARNVSRRVHTWGSWAGGRALVANNVIRGATTELHEHSAAAAFCGEKERPNSCLVDSMGARQGGSICNRLGVITQRSCIHTQPWRALDRVRQTILLPLASCLLSVFALDTGSVRRYRKALESGRRCKSATQTLCVYVAGVD